MLKIDRRKIFPLTGGLILSGCQSRIKTDRPLAKLNEVRVGFIGVGARGCSHLYNLLRIPNVQVKAICDTSNQSIKNSLKYINRAKHLHPEIFTGSVHAYKQLLKRSDLDAVIISTPWKWHAPMATECMKSNKHALVEIPAAITVKGCWDLVKTSEQTGMQCMMLENVCYSDVEMSVLNMCHKGLFGELLHGEGAYIHNMRYNLHHSKPTDGNGYWRVDHWSQKNGNLYPTHGLGPIAQYMSINRGDSLDYLTSTSSPSLGRKQYAEAEFPQHHPRNSVSYDNGDINTTVIKTKLGRTITLQYDTVSYRPYSRKNLIQGTLGTFMAYPDDKADGRLVLKTSANEHGSNRIKDEWGPFQHESHQHPLTRYYKKKSEQMGLRGHGGKDGIMWLRIIDCFRHGLPLDQDVYDAASWSVIVPLSIASASNRSSSIKIPDFTTGKWKSRAKLQFKLPDQ